MVSPCWAAGPYLVCDDPAPVQEVTGYLVKIDGGEATSEATPLHVDLSGWTEAEFSVEIAAQNIWGDSAYCLPFVFTKGLPTAPSNIDVSLE